MALSVKRNFLFSSSELSPSLLVCPIVRLFAAQTALLNFCLQRISSSHLFLLRPHFYLIYLSFYKKKAPYLYFFMLESITILSVKRSPSSRDFIKHIHPLIQIL